MDNGETSAKDAAVASLVRGKAPSPIGDDRAHGHDFEFALPGRMRELSVRILWELIYPCRQQLANAEKERNDAIKQADEALASVEAWATAARDEKNRKVVQIHSTISSAATDIDQICTDAKLHLYDEGVLVSDDFCIPKAEENVSTLDFILERVATEKARLQDFRKKKKPRYWPRSNGARWTLGIVSFGLLVSFPPLVVVWPIIVFLLRLLWVSDATAQYNHLVANSLKLRFALPNLEARMKQDAEDAIKASESRLPPARQSHSDAVNAANTHFSEEAQKIENGFRQIADLLHKDVAELWEDGTYAAKEWIPSEWKDWSPDPSPEFAARIGTLSISANDLQSRVSELDFNFKVPAFIPFTDGRGLLLNATGAAARIAAEALQSAAIRALANTPPGKARFTLIDPVGLGHNVAEFMHLGDFDPELINGKAWTEPQHIEQQLTRLTEDMETVIQTFLRKKYTSIQEYNKEHHEVAEPFRFLIVFDFPVNFSEAAARRLVSIVKNGPRCGVFTFILRDTAKKPSHGFDLKDLEDATTRITTTNNSLDSNSINGHFVWNERDFKDFLLALDRLPPPEISRAIIQRSGEMAAQGMKKEVPFEKLLTTTQKPDSWRVSSTAECLQVPLGPAGKGIPQQLTLGGGQEAHALLVGRTGSGKTNLMHVIITNLALTYSPKELQLYLIDFKGGVGFKRYAERRLPHARVIAIESEREFGMSVLRALDAELKERSETFRAAGVDNLAAYRTKTGGAAPLPRILLVVDEFQEFFTENDDASQQAKIIFDRLARQGRSFGLHFLLATQSLSGSAQLPSSIMGQIKVRIALPCSETDSRLILADDNKAARSLSRPGEAIYNPMGGLVEGNNRFQVALFNEDSDLPKYLTLVLDNARALQISATPIIFEGNELARAEDCALLKEFLAASDWPLPAKSVDLFLGEPIAILPPVAARIRRQSGSNLMILARNESEGVGVCVSALVSILVQQRPGSSRIYIADFTTADSEWAEHAEEIARWFPGDITVIGRQRETGSLFATIAEEVRVRGDSVSSPGSIFLVLQGMHRIKSLRENMDDEDGHNSVELLQTILRDGPEVGVHVIAWADTVANATRGSRKLLAEFGLRVAAVMSTEDSVNFLDSSAASKISKPHRAVFYDEDRPGQLVTFRPYAMLSTSWLKEAGARSRARIENRNVV